MSFADSSRTWESDRETWTRRLLLITLVALAVLLLRDFVRWPFGEDREPAEPRAITPRGELADYEKATIDLFAHVSPSVVYVTTIGLRRSAFNMQPLEIPEGTGSGFVWDEKGHIVTNFHVIASLFGQRGNSLYLKSDAACEVTLEDQSTWEASVAGIAPDNDLAVLRIQAPEKRLRPIAVGTSHDLLRGQRVFAIGNPLGYDQTITDGIVSATEREITAITGRTIQNVIQTNAAINPGNSGGPLVDSSGRLVGVVVAIRRDAQNIGFAIPVNTVNEVIPELITHGRVQRPGLGVVLVPDIRTRAAGIQRGVIVGRVLRDSAAEKAGLRGLRELDNGELVYDIILQIDDVETNMVEDLQEELMKREVGDTVTLRVLRQGTPIDLEATLQDVD